VHGLFPCIRLLMWKGKRYKGEVDGLFDLLP
jgi:hypothetical protein